MKWILRKYLKLIQETAMFDLTNKGYTTGGLDVITGVNLFFKFLLLSPVFLLAGITTATMLKHVLFQGVPTMATPTSEQQQQLREMNRGIKVTGAVIEEAPYVVPTVRYPEAPVLPSVNQKQVSKHPCDVWREAYPELAEELVSGDTCY